MDDGMPANGSENWGLIGSEWAVAMLQAHIQNQSLRHAYLFTGPPGIGRRTLALRLAQALCCTSLLGPAQPCFQCRTCRQVQTMQYPDLAVVQAEQVGGVLKVEPVRELRQTLALKPYQAQDRVAILLRFQEANSAAANALLKTLEEAPAHAVLVLTADSSELLLPTIVSRCEILRLRPSSTDAVAQALQQRGIDQATARLLAHLSGGRPGEALRLLQQPQALEFRRTRLDDLRKLLAASRVEKFAYAEKLAREKELFRRVLLLWLSYWRDVLLAASGSSAPLLNVDRSGELQAMASRLGLPSARKLVQQTERAVEQLDRNVNPRLLAEVLLMDWPHE
jgi:DNA polymerase-3 subunit delta'